MTDYVITSGKSSDYPLLHYGSQFVGSRATYCLDADLISGMDVNTLAIPSLRVSSITSSPVTASNSFFGMSVMNRVNDPLTGVTASTTRSHDCSGGIARWQFIETSAGVYGGFPALDVWVNAHYAAGRDIIFTLFGTPPFYSARPTERNAYSDNGTGGQYNRGIAAEPTDMTKWSAFCTAVATRYLGKIKYYEVWNEPNYHNDGTGPGANTDCFFTGTWAVLSQMTRLANQAIKAVDATAKIICPPVQGWTSTSGLSDTYFTGMMAASDGASGTMKQWIDIIGVHLYLPGSNLTVNLPGMINRVKASMATAGISGEIWDTEDSPFSPSISGLSDVAAQAVLGRCMIIYASMGITRTIYYQYDNTYSGISTRASILAYREYIINLLKSGGILKVYSLTDGRVAYSTSTGVSVI